MSTLLKDIYSLAFYKNLAAELHILLPDFSTEIFITKIFDAHWEQKELKDRMRHTANVLHYFLPESFDKASEIIQQLSLTLMQKPTKGDGLAYLFLPDYIERYGINYFDVSVKTIELVTQLSSCEFAVRPFIIAYPEKMMMQMHAWSTHDNHHVRRLASEGSRPRLPWAMALPAFKKDPNAVLPILENLKNDPSEYVRKSVANNLNDITKDNIPVVLNIIKQWKNHSPATDSIIKHACRNLLKQAHPVVLAHFGLSQSEAILFSDFKLNTPKIAIGENLSFAFTVSNTDVISHTIRLEYAIYYKRQNAIFGKKVFKISERQLAPNESLKINRNQSFKIITTRKFYAGTQQLGVIINGIEKVIVPFELD